MGTRRGHGEGSIYRRASDGLWVGSVDLGYADGKRKRKPVYARTRREVAEKLKAALRDQQQGLPVVVGRQTVKQFLAHWLEDVVKPTKAPKTYATYRDLVRLHIVPVFGRHRLDALMPQHVASLLKEKSDAGLSPLTVHHVRTVLRTALTRR